MQIFFRGLLLLVGNHLLSQMGVAIAAHARLISATERFQLSEGAWWRDWEQTGSVGLKRQAEQLRRLWEAGEIITTDYLVQLRQTLDVQVRQIPGWARRGHEYKHDQFA